MDTQDPGTNISRIQDGPSRQECLPRDFRQDRIHTTLSESQESLHVTSLSTTHPGTHTTLSPKVASDLQTPLV